MKKLLKLRTQAKISQPALFEKRRAKLQEEIQLLEAHTPLKGILPTMWLLERVRALKQA
jgi:hypothetical protein